MYAQPRVPMTLVAHAAALALAVAGGSAVASIVTLGDVSPNPASGVVGGLSIGSTSIGSVTVNGGSSLTADQIYLGSPSPSGNGSLTVTGLGSSTTVTWASQQGNLDIGGAGTGSLSVLDRASFSYGASSGQIPCSNFCWAFVGGAAGSSGSLVVSGGASFTTPRPVIVGQGTLFTMAADGFVWGTPGGTTTGTVRIESGAQASFGSLTVAARGGGNTARTGAEQSFGDALVQGAGTVLSLVRPSYLVGDQALLSVGAGGHGSGIFEVKSGAKFTLDGSSSANTFAGVNLGSGDGTSTGTMCVDGAGTRVEMSGGLGFFNIGNAANATGQLQITGGGLVTGVDASGLVSVNVGRRGASSGNLTVSGTDGAGVASALRLNGVNTVNGAGPFITVARRENNLSSQGSVNVLGGGRIEIDTSTQVLTLGNGQPGMYVGFGDGSSASLTVSGKSALTGEARRWP